MSFRNRTTRFSSRPKDSVSIATTVSIPPPQVTTISRTSRATRFTPTRPTTRQITRPTVVSRPTVVTRPTVSRPTVTQRITRITRVTPRPKPPRDDFTRSLSPFPVVREAFAEEAPKVERAITVERPSLLVTKPRKRTTRLTTRFITPVRTTPKDDITRVATPTVRLGGGSSGQGRVTLAEQRKANQALLDAGLPTLAEQQRREGLSDFDRAFASFGGGVTAEITNIGSIAGLSEFSEEAGSLAIDLPFAVVGETFTKPSVVQEGGLFGGGGFGGLGFDFRVTPDFDAGFEKSGKIQGKIREKFEEDPARALGSVFAVAGIEAGLFVATGGAGRLAIQGFRKVGSKLATKKGTEVALKFNKEIDKLFDEEDVIRSGAQPLGGGNFASFRGTESLGKLITKDVKGVTQSIRVLEQPVGGKPVKVSIQAIDSSGKQFRKTIKIKFPKIAQDKIRKDDLIIPKEKAKFLDVLREGKTLEGAGGRVRVKVNIAKESEVPITIIQTSKQVRTFPEFASRSAESAFIASGGKAGVGVKFIKEIKQPKTIAFGKNIPADFERAVFQNPKTIDMFLLNTDTTLAQSVKSQLRSGLKPPKRETKGILRTLSEGSPTPETFIAIREGIGKTVAPVGVDIASFTTKSLLKQPEAIKTFALVVKAGGKTQAREKLTPTQTRILLEQGQLGELRGVGISAFGQGGFLGGGRPLLATESVKKTFIGEVAFFEKGKIPKGLVQSDLDLVLAKQVTKVEATDIFGRPLTKGKGIIGSLDFAEPSVTKLGILEGSLPKAGLPKITSTAKKNIRKAKKQADDSALNLEKIFASEGKAGTTIQVTKVATKQTPTNVGKVAEIFRVDEVAIRFPRGAGIAPALSPILAQQQRGRKRARDDLSLISDLGVGQRQKSGSDQIFDLGVGIDQGIDQGIFTRQDLIPRGDRGGTGLIQDIFTGTKVREDPITGTVTVPEQGFFFPPPTTTTGVPPQPPKTPALVSGGLPLPFGFDEVRRRRKRADKRRRSRLGGRLFDIADEPFGEVAVGLGFFVETRRGETSIEEALGIGEFSDEPITRQEKQARARLGRNRKRRNEDEFGLGNFFG